MGKARADMATWNGGSGNWSDATQWTSTTGVNFPNNGNAGQNWDATIGAGSTTLDINIAVQNFTFSGGNVTGGNNLTVNQLFTWAGGDLDTSGTITANGGISINASTSGDVVLSQGTLINAANKTATFAGTAPMYIGNATLINDGTFLAQSATAMYDDGGNPSFDNNGIFTSNPGSGGTFIIGSSITFNNSGTVNAQTGTLDLEAGDNGNTTGAFNVSAGATLQFDGAYNLIAGSSIAGAGLVDFDSNTVTVDGTYNVTGTSGFTGATVNFNSTIKNLGSGPLNISGGAVNFNSNNLTIPSINLSGGDLGGTANLVSSGSFSWTGGTIDTSGTITANGGISINASTSGNVELSQGTLINAANKTATFAGTAPMYIGNATLINDGTFLAQSATAMYYDGGNPTFDNNGIFTSNPGSGGTFIIGSSITFNNSGTVNVQTGTLDLEAGDNGNTTGAFNVSAGATLQFDGAYNLVAGSSIAGAGLVEFDSNTVTVDGTYNVTGTSSFTGATVNFNSTIKNLGGGPLNINSGAVNFNSNNLTVPAINLSGGDLGGTANLVSSGSFSWTGGTIDTSGTITANGGLGINAGASGSVVLSQGTLINAANKTATFAGTEYMYIGNATLINDGTFLAQSATAMYYDGGNPSFDNNGIFTSTPGSGGTFTIGSSITFNNSGTVNAQTGTLDLAGGDNGNTTGAFNVSAGATLQFDGAYNLIAGSSIAGAGLVDFDSNTVTVDGTYNVTGTSGFTGATVNFNSTIKNLGSGPLNISGGSVNFNSNNLTIPSINLSGGNLGGTANLISSGSFSWTGGTIDTSGTITANGGLGINTNGGGVVIYPGTLINAAGKTATFAGTGAIYVGGATFINNGTFLAQSTSGIYYYGGNLSTVDNVGTFTVNPGAGTFTIGTTTFNNSGTVNAQTGTLDLEGGDNGSTTGAFNVSAGATLQFDGAYTLIAGSSIAGAGLVDFDSNTVTVDGTYNVTGTSGFTGATVNFNSTIKNLGSGPLNISGGSVNFNSNNLTLPSINLSNGDLGGTANLVSSGSFSWTGGEIDTTGTITANGGISINGGVVLSQGTLINAVNKTATFSGGYIYLLSGATFINNGMFLAENSNAIYYDGGNISNFDNNGTFTVSPAGGMFTIGYYINFNNKGVLRLNGGTLTVESLVSQAGGQLAGSGTIGGSVQLDANMPVSVPAAGTTLTISAPISGAGFGLVTSGPGTLDLAAANSYSGGTTVTSGTLVLGDPSALGSIGGSLAVNGGTLDLRGLSITVGALSGSSGGVITSMAGGIATFKVFDAANTVFGGSLRAGTGQIYLIKSGIDTLTLTGSSNLGSNLLIGGSGGIQISGGGNFTDVTGAAGDIGTNMAAVSGSGSKWTNTGDLFVGYSGTGTFMVTGGGSVNTGINDYIAFAPGSGGAATVSGSDSAWTTTDNLAVGGASTGTLTITGRGMVTDAGGFVGYRATGNGMATVSGTGSKWINTNNLAIGYLGAGTLSVNTGGAVSDVYGYIGTETGSHGTVTVSGSGSSWNNTGSLAIGTAGAGSVTITGGGALSVTALTTIGSLGTLQLDGLSTFSTAALAINGGTFRTLGALSFAHSAVLGTGGVKLDTDGFNSTFSGALSGSGGLIKSGAGALTLTGASSYTGPTSIISGTLALTTGSIHTASLGNTAITVDSGATFSPTLGASPATKVVNVGTTGTASAGGKLTLSPGSSLSMADGAIGTFNLIQQNAFSGPAFTIGAASGLAPTLTFDIGNAATGPDRIDVTKTVTVLATGGLITIDALAGDSSLTAGNYDLIISGGGFSGTGGNGFTLTDTTLAVAGTTYDFSLANSTAADEVLTVSVAAVVPADQSGPFAGDGRSVPGHASTPLIGTTAVPEPGSAASLLSAFGVVAAWHLRRRR